MMWIWQEYSEDNIYTFEPHYDPVHEAYINLEDNVRTNVFVRFEKIFRDLRPVSEKAGLFNVTVHFLAHQDLLNGFDHEEAICCVLENEIMRGAFGKEVKRLMASGCLSSYDKKYVLKALYEYKISGEHSSPFDEVFAELFKDTETAEKIDGDALLFGLPEDMKHEKKLCRLRDFPEVYYRRSNETAYYYCGKRTEQKENKFRLILRLFADITDNKEVLWDNCIGIIGAAEDECAYPVIGEVQII